MTTEVQVAQHAATTDEAEMHPMLLATFAEHAAATYDKQTYLGDLIGDLPWEFEMETGLLKFGDRYRWRTQIIGTHSERSGLWLWGWANESSGLPDELVLASRSLRALGLQYGIGQLCEVHLPTNRHDGHFWSVIAAGLCSSNAYYCGAYEGGAVFLLIHDPIYRQVIEQPLVRFASLLPKALSTFDITDHRLTVKGYARFLGLELEEVGDRLTVRDGAGRQMVAHFNEHRRLTDLAGDAD